MDRKPTYHQLIETEKIQVGIAADDGVAIHFKELEISKVVSSRPNAKAYNVAFEKKLIETEISTEFLGSK